MIKTCSKDDQDLDAGNFYFDNIEGDCLHLNRQMILEDYAQNTP
jgi:hypothetical protein